MSKLDLSLQLALQRCRADASDATSELAGAQVVEVVVAHDGDADLLEHAGMRVSLRSKGYALGTIRVSSLPELDALEPVQRVSQAPALRQLIDETVPAINVPAVWNGPGNFRGRDVIIAVIDYDGFDVGLKDFRRPSDQHSRVLRFWDQTKERAHGKLPPRRFKLPGMNGDKALPASRYGTEYTQDDLTTILQGMAAGNAQVPGADDPGKTGVGHGTHVAGIAAGNGSQPDGCMGHSFTGVAPEADLVLVKIKKDLFGFMDAVFYIVQFAATASNFKDGKPRAVVINCSLTFGDAASNPDIDGALLKPLDALFAASPSRVIVAGSGNNAHGAQHAKASVPAAGATPTKLQFLVPDHATGPVTLDVRFTGVASLGVSLQSPKAGALPGLLANPKPGVSSVTIDGNKVEYRTGVLPAGAAPAGALSASISRPNPAASASPLPPAPGLWTILLGPAVPQQTPVDAWISAGSFLNASEFDTIAAPARANNVIAVGAYDLKGTLLGSSAGQLCRFSGRGSELAASEKMKPDLVAPGGATMAPLSRARKTDKCSACCVDFYGSDFGTSMAAPHVAGVVALMLQKNKALTFEGVRKILRETTSVPDAGLIPAAGPLPNARWGFGIVNAAAAVGKVEPSSASASGVHAGALLPANEDPLPAAPASPLEPLVPDWDAPIPPTAPSAPWMPRIPFVGERVRELQEPLARSPALQLVIALVSTHVDEINRLINSNRRVAAVWRRHGGPALVRHLVRKPLAADLVIPAEVEGYAVPSLLARLLAILQRFGGAALAADARRYHALIVSAPGSRLSELDQLVAGVAGAGASA